MSGVNTKWYGRSSRSSRSSRSCGQSGASGAYGVSGRAHWLRCERHPDAAERAVAVAKPLVGRTQ